MLSPCRKDEVADPDSLDTPLERNASLFIKIKIIIKYTCFIISLSDHLKLSIDIFIMSVRHIFAQLRFIFKKRSCSRPRQKVHHVCFLCFIKATCLLILWVHTNKGRPFTVPNYVLLLPLSEKNNGVGNFKLFPLKKNARDCPGATMSWSLLKKKLKRIFNEQKCFKHFSKLT